MPSQDAHLRAAAPPTNIPLKQALALCGCITTDSPLTPSQQCSRAGQAYPSQSGASEGVAVSMQTRAPGALPECDSHAVLTLNAPQAAGSPEPLSRRPHFMPEGQLPSEPWGALAEVCQEAAMLTVKG